MMIYSLQRMTISLPTFVEPRHREIYKHMRNESDHRLERQLSCLQIYAFIVRKKKVRKVIKKFKMKKR